MLCSCDPFGGAEACRDLPGTAGRGLRGQQHLQQPLCTAGAPRCVPKAHLLQNTGCPQPSINVWVAEVGTAARRKQELNDRRVLLRLKGAWQIAPLQPQMSSPPGEGQHSVRLGQTSTEGLGLSSPSVSLSCGCLWLAAWAGLRSRAVFLCSTQQGTTRTVGFNGPSTDTIVVGLILSCNPHTTGYGVSETRTYSVRDGCRGKPATAASRE